jgi:homogentisate phytyltransferase / homogentisate geranylgeranyltransferase
MRFLKTLWQFGRPHTIVGSFCSITALFAIALSSTQSQCKWPVYLGTLFSALACNLFIVGLNQYQDVAIDRINKPNLPLAAGTLSKQQGLRIVLMSLALSIALAAMQGAVLLGLILAISAIGAAYSLPPIQLKRHYTWAALCITVVRGLLVNLGMTVHFIYALTGSYQLPLHIWPLTLFVVGFSFGVAWFKDIPDTEGDEKYRIKTLALSITKQKAFQLGMAVVGMAYLMVMVAPFVIDMPINRGLYLIAQLLCFVAFIATGFRLNLNSKPAVQQFYMLFWGLFFLQYFIYPLSYFV